MRMQRALLLVVQDIGVDQHAFHVLENNPQSPQRRAGQRNAGIVAADQFRLAAQDICGLRQEISQALAGDGNVRFRRGGAGRSGRSDAGVAGRRPVWPTGSGAGMPLRSEDVFVRAADGAMSHDDLRWFEVGGSPPCFPRAGQSVAACPEQRNHGVSRRGRDASRLHWHERSGICGTRTRRFTGRADVHGLYMTALRRFSVVRKD